ncbi:MAG: dipicolinate synthase subunit B [Ruminococcaceae bacterium]|nr:dipicolinate synthase subunit B [Oscillospiraceae bacterium]
MIGWGFCGSFCTMANSISAMKRLSQSKEILPIFSYSLQNTVTRFGTPEYFRTEVENITGKAIISTIEDAEPIGPKNILSAMVIAPCTGNTLAKIANGITDTPVTMAAKAHMRNGNPLVIALASNDAMSANFKNIAALIEKKNVYFVPLVQDDPIKKPSSLVADFSKIEETIKYAIRGIQIRPLFL